MGVEKCQLPIFARILQTEKDWAKLWIGRNGKVGAKKSFISSITGSDFCVFFLEMRFV